MRLVRGVVGSRRGRIVVAAVLAWLAWQAWLTLAAPGKVAADIPRDADRVNVLVTLPFAPERFHVIAFQRYGRISGTLDTQVELRGVRPRDLTAVARPYWVRRVELLPPGR